MAVSIPKIKSNGFAENGRRENNGFVPYYSNGENRLYFGDNLDVLELLTHDKAICGKVDLIYIDPPYSTGGIFQTRTQKDAYTDTLSGNNYLEFMRNRLVLLHKLLSPKGSIYVHLDSIMVFHVKVIMDEIFGGEYFQGMITRKKCKPKNYTRKTFGNISDYILFYNKSEYPNWNRPYQDWTDEKMLKEYPFIEEGTGRRHKRVPVHAPGTRNGASGQPWRGLMPPPGKHWQYVPETLDEMDARGEIHWSSNGNPRRKVYFDESKGVPVQDIWLDFLDINNQNTKGTGYPTEKNPELLKLIIEASSHKGDLVLDCFAGSGTTLAVADELGRKWIGVDNSEEAINTMLDRFSEGLTALGDFVEKKETVNGNGAATLFDIPQSSATNAHVHKITHFTFLAEPLNGEAFEEKINKIEGLAKANGASKIEK